MYSFVPIKSFVQLLDISSKYFIFLETLNSGFPFIEVWFTYQNPKLLETENETNIILDKI